MVVRRSAKRIMITCERVYVEWARMEGQGRSRSIAWMFQEALRQWRNRLQRDRSHRVERRYDRERVQCSEILSSGVLSVSSPPRRPSSKGRKVK